MTSDALTRFASTRLATLGGIPYKQNQGFPKFAISKDGVTAQEEYLIRSSDLNDLFQEAFPVPYITEDGYAFFPSRRTMPGASLLRTKTMTARPHTGSKPADPFGLDSGAPNETYDDAYLVTIDYETWKNEDEDPKDPRTFLERSISGGGEFISLGPQNTETGDKALGSDGSPQPEDTTDNQQGTPDDPTETLPTADPNIPFVKFVPTAEFSFKWPLVARPPWRTMFRYLGTVNGYISDSSGTLDDIQYALHQNLFFNAEPETILYKGFSATQKFVWRGSSVVVQPWEVELQFSLKRVEEPGVGGPTDGIFGWNHVWVPREQRWRRLFRRKPGGGKLDLYKMRNHLNLFIAGTEDDEAASA